MSSLASQLQNIASLDASRLTSRTGAPSTKSYLFPARVASSHDLDSVFALGQSGFQELLSLDSGFEEFEDEIFSASARRVDRMMLNQEENRRLDVVLGRCLRRLGRWIGIMAGGKCIEWLVRRFRVHELNAETVIQVFLPYHESPNFARMLAILTIPQTSVYYAPFSPLVKKAQEVPRSYISNAFSAARDPSLRLLNDVVGMLKRALDEGVVHRALLAFWTGLLVDMLENASKGEGLKEGSVKVLVEAFVEVLSTPKGGADVNAAVYPPLVLLSRYVTLADGPFLAILSALLTPSSGAAPLQRVMTLLVLLSQRPGWTLGLGEGAAEGLAKVPQLGQLLAAATEKYGFEEALGVVIGSMAENVEKNAQHITALVDAAALSDALVRTLVSALVAHPSPAASTLLSSLRERHAAAVDAALVASHVDLGALNLSSSNDAFVEVHSADAASRVEGVKAMYDKLASLGIDAMTETAVAGEDDITSARTAVLARLADDDEAVINAVYARSNLLLPLLRGANWVDIVRPSFIAAKPSQAIVHAHLAFAAQSHLSSSTWQAVFTKLLVPTLLSIDGRHVLGPNEFGLFAESPALAFLNGVDVGDAAAKDDIVKRNKAVIEAVAGVIKQDGGSAAFIDALVDNLDSPVLSARLLATLVLAEVLPSSHVSTAQMAKILASLSHPLSGQLRDIVNVESPTTDALLRSVSSKPASGKTQQRVALCLLVSMSRSPRSVPVAGWLNELDDLSAALYRWANDARLSPAVGRAILQAVFTHAGQDALVFLAAVWTSDANASIKSAALQHAAAFVAAAKTQHVDLQAIVPAILVALQNGEAAVRQAGIALLEAIAPLSGDDIYAINTVYGQQSDLVQLLKPSDLKAYLASLLNASDEIALDPTRLIVVHAATLECSNHTSKKDVSHSRAVVEWLFSHAAAWRHVTGRIALLGSLNKTVNPARLRGATALLAPLVAGNEQVAASAEAKWVEALPPATRSGYLALLFGAFVPRHASVLSENGSDTWAFMLDVFRKHDTTSVVAQLRLSIAQRLAGGFFPSLQVAKKVALISVYVQALRDAATDDALELKALLHKLVLAPEELIAVLQTMAQAFESSTQRKKVKHDEVDDTAEQAVNDLTILVESRDWAALPGNAPLVGALMGVLSSLLTKRQAIKEGVDYLEQELLGAILAGVEKITDQEEIKKAHVGIEVVIKVIRASSNPRTSQRALLVAAELARLIPDAVLHNVMPIFTFMGAADFQRDDAYSFGVVEKTVARIVPVMTASLKDKASTKLELYNESLTIISIFTDMAGRLPRHRTLAFFVHLVKSLGASDFLPPIVMLLLDRTTTKAGRGGPADLPLALANAFEVDVRAEALKEIVIEASRLVADLSILDDKQAFLSHLSASDPDRTLRQACALLAFSTTLAEQMAGKACHQPTVEAVVKILIQLAATTATPAYKSSDIGRGVQGATLAVMGLLSVDSFLRVVIETLESGSEADIQRALDVFTARLPLVRADIRVSSAPATSTIVRVSAGLLGAGQSVQPILKALGAIATTAVSAEDGALAGVVPALVALVKKVEGATALTVLSLLEVLVRHLVSRAIPYLQSIVDVALPLIGGAPTAVAKQAFKTLSALVEALPSFVSGKQVGAILAAAARSREADSAAALAIISTVTKKVATKTLFPVVLELWKTMQTEDQHTLEAFFHILRQTLRHADRKALPALLKPVFAFFLDVFDLRHRLAVRGVAVDAIAPIEDAAVHSFLELVNKLNEGTFKPLFVRLYDWAVIDLADGKRIDDGRLVERKMVLLRVMLGLLEKYRHLLSPYMATLMPHIDELLSAYAAGEITDEGLWKLLHEVLAVSLEVDDSAYYTDAHLTRLVPAIVAQLPLFPRQTLTDASPPARALAALAGATTVEPVLRALNSALCMATRADEAATRIAALRALDAVWARQAEEMVAFVPETVSEFLAELLEDESADVEALARRVLAKIEKVTGSLKEYLE